MTYERKLFLKSSGCLSYWQCLIRVTYGKVLCDPDNIRSFRKLSGWHNVFWSLSPPDDLAILSISSGWLMDIAACHLHDLRYYLITSGRHDVIWTLGHPGELDADRISSGGLMDDAFCHLGDLAVVGISSGWVTANSLCHPDIPFLLMSSGWLNWGWYLIRCYGIVFMSPGWHTPPFLTHPDEIANFDFSPYAVALQRFRTILLVR